MVGYVVNVCVYDGLHCRHAGRRTEVTGPKVRDEEEEEDGAPPRKKRKKDKGAKEDGIHGDVGGGACEEGVMVKEEKSKNGLKKMKKKKKKSEPTANTFEVTSALTNGDTNGHSLSSSIMLTPPLHEEKTVAGEEGTITRKTLSPKSKPYISHLVLQHVSKDSSSSDSDHSDQSNSGVMTARKACNSTGTNQADNHDNTTPLDVPEAQEVPGSPLVAQNRKVR